MGYLIFARIRDLPVCPWLIVSLVTFPKNEADKIVVQLKNKEFDYKAELAELQ